MNSSRLIVRDVSCWSCEIQGSDSAQRAMNAPNDEYGQPTGRDILPVRRSTRQHRLAYLQEHDDAHHPGQPSAHDQAEMSTTRPPDRQGVRCREAGVGESRQGQEAEPDEIPDEIMPVEPKSQVPRNEGNACSVGSGPDREVCDQRQHDVKRPPSKTAQRRVRLQSRTATVGCGRMVAPVADRRSCDWPTISSSDFRTMNHS